MGITRTVTTRVHCDVCGEWVTGWESEGIGISREWAKYFVRLQGCTGGAEADKKRHVICISDGCLEEIGEYATKERCLEVLDEIQKACVSYLFMAGGAAVIRGGMDVQPFAAVIPRLYEMPEK